MNTTVVTYLIYLTVSVALTIWVAGTLFKNGLLFLIDAFGGNAELANSVNRLLVVGFYLINLGYITLNLKVRGDILDARASIEILATQVGLVLLVLGGMHFFNIFVFNRVRRRHVLESVPPPVLPDRRLDRSGVDCCDPDVAKA